MLKRRFFYLAYAAISILYVVAVLMAPLGATRFNLTPAKTHLLQLSIYLPIILIWGVAVYGVERFKNYTNSIKAHKDGGALNTVANGLIILVAAIIANGLFGVLRPWALMDGWLSAFTIMSNYLSVFLPLIAFCFMYAGSVQLRHLIKRGRLEIKGFFPLFLILSLIAVVYIWQLFSYKYIDSTTDPTKYSSFYMSDVMVLLTIGLPYLFSWALAIKAALNIAEYRRKVSGVIYRGALFRMTVGLMLVVAFYISVQLLLAFSTFFARAGLATLLLIVYLIILLYASGFLVIASGTKKLSFIEKVR